MSINEMSTIDVAQTIRTAAQDRGISVTDAAVGSAGSYFVLVNAEGVNLELVNDLTIFLDSVYMGAIDVKGNFIEEEDALIHRGCDGAVVFGCNQKEEFKKYMMIISNSNPTVLCKGGKWVDGVR